jgi:Dolichyl-phosphate-mannose-protein mannosyltransferase
VEKYLKPLLLTFCLAILVVVANSWKIFDSPPHSIHQWRQSDCAAYVKTFYRTGASVFNPATYNLAGKEGRVVSEFPILYYIAAKIQHLVGEHYWVIRGLTFLCYLLGLYALLACVKRWVSDPIYAVFPIVLLAASPYYYYYAVNFLPNVPAISFSFVGLYYYLLYEDTKKLAHLIWGTLFFTLATALKPTDGGILWIAYLLTWAVQYAVKFYKKVEKPQFFPMMISAIFILLTILGWVKYVNWYNDLNGNHQNLIGTFPLWEMADNLIRYTILRINTEWHVHFHQKYIFEALKVSFLAYLLLWWWLDKFLRLMTLFLFIGLGIYAVLWFKAFTDHDYYQLIYVVPFVFLVITLMEYFGRVVSSKLPKYGRWASYGILISVLVLGIYHNKKIQHGRYTNPIFENTNPVLFEIEPYLRSIGIKTTDKVVSVPDNSPNISLNAMNQYGYTEIFNDDRYNIHTFKEQGAAYLIVNDTSYLKNPLYQPFTKKKIGEYKGIMIFDIR